MVGSAISLTDTTGQAWEYLQGALLDAAADDRITLLEVLQKLRRGADDPRHPAIDGAFLTDWHRLLRIAGLLLSIFLEDSR